MWFGTPASGMFKYYVGGVDTATINSGGLLFTHTTSTVIDMSAAAFFAFSFNNAATLGIASAAGNIFSGIAVGDLCLRGGSGKKLYLGTNASAAAITMDSANATTLNGITTIAASMIF
jgi:hypothetical protein